MTTKQQLLQEIEQSLADNDYQTLSILLEDEEQEYILDLASEIKDKDKSQKLKEFLKNQKESRVEAKQDKDNLDKIRKINERINNVGSESEDNIVEKQIKLKKQLKLQEKAGYDFYGNVKCLLIAYGILKPAEDSIKMMHSQIQVLFEIVLKFISGRVEQGKGFEVNVKKNICLIFKDQTKLFESITKQYKKATKSVKKNQNAIIQDSEDDFPSDEQQNNHIDHMASNTAEQGEYFAMLTSNMGEKQYESYSECRAVNFIYNNSKKSQQGQKKFTKFLDSDSLVLKPQMKIFELLSFICCRFIRKIVFTSIRDRNEGKLVLTTNSITHSQIKKIGNSLIEQCEKTFKQIQLKQISNFEIAKSTFIEDVQNNDFKVLMPKKYSSKDKSAQQIWMECKMYQQMWTQRINGEKQVQQDMDLLENGQIDPKTEYAKFILKHLNFYKTKGKINLWKKYFTQEKVDTETSEIGKPRKRVKLQSLKN